MRPHSTNITSYGIMCLYRLPFFKFWLYWRYVKSFQLSPKYVKLLKIYVSAITVFVFIKISRYAGDLKCLSFYLQFFKRGEDDVHSKNSRSHGKWDLNSFLPNHFIHRFSCLRVYTQS